MSDTVIVGLLSLVGSLIAVWATNRRASALIAYRLEQLEKKVTLHNNLVERMYAVEERTSVTEEKVKVVNHRIDDLEAKGGKIA